MKKIVTAIALFCSFSVYSQSGPKDHVIQAWSQVDAAKQSVKLTWLKPYGSSTVSIYKKLKTDLTFASAIKTVLATDTTYTDTAIKPGVMYEYMLQQTINTSTGARAYGVVATGIALPPVTDFKRLLLIIPENVYDSMGLLYDTLYNDLVGDGYRIQLSKVPANSKDTFIKKIVSSYYYGAPSIPTSVFLFGHVAVPYCGSLSGQQNEDYPADAHVPDHNGAWAADGYYSDVDGIFTDYNTIIDGSRTANKNNPSDGKWDQHFFPSLPEVMVGRVDLSSLSDLGVSEMNLYRRYIRKLHQYKMARINVPRKGYIDERLGLLGTEAPGRTTWTNLSPLFGPKNVTKGTNYFTDLKAAPYLFAMESSTGGYNSYNGIGTTVNYKDTIKSVFNTSFGSYFGDWDINNNILRGCLGSPGYTLTNAWNGRPQWYFQHMGMGENIGYSTLVSQLNFIDNDHQTYYAGAFPGRTTINLMGDPTLRLHVVSPVENIVANATNGNKSVVLNWNVSKDPEVIGYYVYRSNAIDGKFEPVVTWQVKTNTLTDNLPYSGKNIYMVRAVKLETSSTGTYYNQSIGTFTSISGMIGRNLGVEQFNPLQITLFPNPSNSGNFTLIRNNIGSEMKVNVCDVQGRTINAVIWNKGENNIKLNIQSSKGVYFVKIASGSEIKTIKTIVD